MALSSDKRILLRKMLIILRNRIYPIQHGHKSWLLSPAFVPFRLLSRFGKPLSCHIFATLKEVRKVWGSHQHRGLQSLIGRCHPIIIEAAEAVARISSHHSISLSI